ncbi:IniB N-terminal domain-containing protein [Pseudonocardia sp. CA-107938]|uniref:IniB N-terminal domain-containing protein n=1 Tax=Pseudonocardia sp. CA-107938 TaxID=3240021 RepID=UPI003D94F59F
MTTSTSLIDLIMSLLRDPAQRAAFQEDPEGFLASCGDISPEDVKDAIELADDRDSGHGGSHVHVPPPPHPHPHPGESDHEAAVRYLNTYITNNYSIDDHSIDNSVHQNIDNEGGTFNQDIHNVSNSGDGAVVAGDDIDGSTITTGDHNQVGDHNVQGSGNVVGNDNQAVTGDDNTTGFGSGAVSSVGGGVSVGAGGAFSGAGNASTDDHSVSQHDVGNTTTTTHVDDSFNNESDLHYSDDHSTAVSVDDDHSTSTHTDTHVNDSFNVDN